MRTVAIRGLLAALALVGTAGQGLDARQGAASPLSVLHVQGGVHVITGAGANVTVQVGNGKNGVVLVDTPRPDLVPQVLAEVRRLSNNRPIRYIVNTSVNADAIAGNAALVGPAASRGTGGAPFGFVGLGRPSILAQENVLNRLSAATSAFPPAALPTMTYYLPTMDFYANGEAILLHHAPAAHTDSDSIVHFRGSDVISTGALFTPGRYPVIDLERGGSVQGLVLALGQVLAIAVPEAFSEGGTKIVPGRGRIAEETDVAEFRDMLAIVRDRVQDGIKKGQTEAQIVASRPSRDYDAEYGAGQAEADRFVGTIYRSLMQAPRAGGQS
jgi:glyoxylase-like metal-dependent hydrolase (beta-lactamase superfamily II)